MAFQTISLRNKGQITLPADIRDALGLKQGDTLLVEREGRRIILISAEDVEDPSAGMLAEYAYTRNPDPAEERHWIAKHIAETAVDYE